MTTTGGSAAAAWRAALATLALSTMTAAGAAADAPPPGYALDAGHTFVHWEVLHLGTSTIRGRFDRAAGSVVRFDAKAQRIEVGISVDTASVDTGSAPFDRLLRGADFLAVDAHPQAYFTARSADWDGEVPARIHGEFTLRGTSRPLELRALRWRCGLNPVFRREVCGGDFEGELTRSDFGITHSLPLVANRVRLLIQVEAVADAP